MFSGDKTEAQSDGVICKELISHREACCWTDLPSLGWPTQLFQEHVIYTHIKWEWMESCGPQTVEILILLL